MKTIRIIAMAVLLSALGTAASWAQQKGESIQRYRITSGPGAGVLLETTASFPNIFDPVYGAEGRVGTGPECDCAHYHGVLFGDDDPDEEGCGWGCIVQEPCTAAQALGTLRNVIAESTATNTALATKLNGILDAAEAAISSDCNPLFENTINAFADEVLGATENGAFDDSQASALIQAAIDYVVLGLEAIAPPFPPPPPEPKACKVSLLLRHGSGAQSKLFDAKRKVNAGVAEVVTLDAQGCPGDGPYEWEFKFKGAAKNEVPSRAGISFTSQRFCVLSEKPTTVTVTVIFHCPDGKTVKDTATINIQ